MNWFQVTHHDHDELLLEVDWYVPESAGSYRADRSNHLTCIYITCDINSCRSHLSQALFKLQEEVSQVLAMNLNI